jgi:hypothetical protein
MSNFVVIIRREDYDTFPKLAERQVSELSEYENLTPDSQVSARICPRRVRS